MNVATAAPWPEFEDEIVELGDRIIALTAEQARQLRTYIYAMMPDEIDCGLFAQLCTIPIDKKVRK